MNNFRECFEDDLDNAFFDLDDFADEHTIDGKKCVAVFTTTEIVNGKMSYGLMKATLNPKETAINKVQPLLFVRKSDLRAKVTPNSMITLDGVKYFVQQVTTTQGVCRLVLEIHAV
ncbi:hypothetical protein [Pseudobutyrivibrio sp.]|uniref:hypothetical protein n=1 Tax=Pseudobutyrivibrio sp. TaxID=2014367 RepID=UPI001DE0B5DC|nr:hypothetical protein [Pseudobutyrivibrio sp.]MBE5910891.1 hypothetical protein [Pseudobutyrivibrio sp.]